MPVPTFKTSPGSYHLSGCLETAPEAFLRKRFSLLRNMLRKGGSATIICVLPLPCCRDESHMVNWAEANFNNILVGVSTAYTAMGWAG